MGPFLFFINFASAIAIVAQLVERWLPKPKVAGSCPVYRSEIKVPDSGAFSYSIGLGSQGLSDGSLPARLSRRSRDRAPSIAQNTIF